MQIRKATRKNFRTKGLRSVTAISKRDPAGPGARSAGRGKVDIEKIWVAQQTLEGCNVGGRSKVEVDDGWGFRE